MIAIRVSTPSHFPLSRIAKGKLPITGGSLAAIVLLLVFCMVQTVSAATFGDFTFTKNLEQTAITITDYPTTATGAVIIPDTIEGLPVTVIGTSAFAQCSLISSVAIPATVTTIDFQAFSGCSALTSAPIPSGVTSLGAQAFYQCGALTAMTIPAGVTDISDSMFEGCASLSSVTLNSGVTRIGNYSFRSCGSLTNLLLPNTVTSIGIGAFSICSNLENMSLPGVLQSIGGTAFADCTNLAAINLAGTALQSMGASAFARCNALTSVSFPSTLAGIPALAFDTCTALSSVTIPEGVTSIGNAAFRLCPALTSIHLPASITSIDCLSNGQPFNRCNNLASITVSPGNTSFVSEGGVLFSADKTQLYAYPAGLTGASYAIPFTVQVIKHSALRGCKFTSVTISSSASSIESLAFSSCSQLLSATFAGNAPTTTGSTIFGSSSSGTLPAAGFLIYYYPAAATSFSAPATSWKGYPIAQIGSLTPIQTWLQTHGLPLDQGLDSDPNGDGVSLLMAYALNLNPNQNLGGSLPTPVLSSEQLTMSFYAGTGGVSYVVETSTDLIHWTTSGVTVYAPDANQVRTAAVNSSDSSRYLRLVVTH